MKIIKQDNISHDEWLENRRKGIGGSDAGAIMGFNKYKSPFTLYLEKIGSYKSEFDSEAAYFGNVLEDVVRKEFEKRTGKKVTFNNDLYVHEKYPFMQANLDGWIEEEKAILECKTASEYLKDEWTGDEVPASYLCQVHHYMAVTGAERAYIAVLVGGNKFIWKVVEKSIEFEEMLIAAEKDFWENYVLAENPPPMDGHDSTSEMLGNMYPEDDGSEIMLTKEQEVVLDALEVIKQEIKQLELQKKQYENEIKKTMEFSKIGHTQKHKVIYSSYNKPLFDSKAMKERYPDIYEEFSDSKSVRVMRINKL